MSQKSPCKDCNDTGVVRTVDYEGTHIADSACHCGATGEMRVAKATSRNVESTASLQRYFRGAKVKS